MFRGLHSAFHHKSTSSCSIIHTSSQRKGRVSRLFTAKRGLSRAVTSILQSGQYLSCKLSQVKGSCLYASS